MKKLLKKLARPLADWLFKRLTGRTALEAASLRRTDPVANKASPRQVERRSNGGSPRQINLVFVCHMPALWGMFDSIHRNAVADPRFRVSVVALPCMHPNIEPGHYSDLGMREYLEEKSVDVVAGYDAKKNVWLTPESLHPDFVLFQTPYNLFPQQWSAGHIARFASVCYVPYGTTLFRGDVDEIVHPEPFFRSATLIFAENRAARDRLRERFSACKWFRQDMIVLAGSPKLDYVSAKSTDFPSPWKQRDRRKRTRILWTPRWWTNDGTCHFFDYTPFFMDFCSRHDDVDFVLRPHPLSIQNFLNTGELTLANWQEIEQRYASAPNMSIDMSGEYRGSFLTSDILVTDISSMMMEYLVTGKPIVYTHRTDLFNELGRALSEGFYWVRNREELATTLDQLISGIDPLREKRARLIDRITFMPEGGSGAHIKNILKTHFENRAGGLND